MLWPIYASILFLYTHERALHIFAADDNTYTMD